MYSHYLPEENAIETSHTNANVIFRRKPPVPQYQSCNHHHHQRHHDCDEYRTYELTRDYQPTNAAHTIFDEGKKRAGETLEAKHACSMPIYTDEHKI